jgi:hypothetical protein
MPNYQNSKIYKLVGNGKIYVGSTTMLLSQRRCQHVTDYRKNSKITSKDIVSDPNHYIELIEYYPCNTKEELLKREGHWIRQLDCVNIYISGRTYEEYREDNKEKIKADRKQYMENNKERLSEIKKKYREQNRDEILQKKLIYRESRRAELCEKQKAYYQLHKEAIQAKKTLNRQIKRLETLNNSIY